MNNPDNPEKIIELPMTKSVVKAMDAVQEFAKTKVIYIVVWLAIILCACVVTMRCVCA